MEVWKDIENYEGLYQVSNLGNVRSLPRNTTKGKILKIGKRSNGYFCIGLCKNGKVKNYLIHRLVAAAFIPNPENLPEVNHKDENKSNNRVENLEWCDKIYNNNYGTRIERVAEKKSKPVLQFDLEGNLIFKYPSTNEIQRRFGFSSGHICKCCNGKLKTAYGFIWRYANP